MRRLVQQDIRNPAGARISSLICGQARRPDGEAVEVDVAPESGGAGEA